MDAQGNYVLPDGATVEKSRMIPSEDQWDYVCRWGSDTGEAHTRCLFVVAPGT
jgi:formylglycine-generating enzyme required for sulfatase activity